MGRTPEGEDRLAGLFSETEIHSVERASNLPLDTPALRFAIAERAPAQTDAKSRLIAKYLSYFQLITRGGLYIDGFAAPQSPAHHDAWTARRVLEIEPPRLRTFWLFDIDPKGVAELRKLKAKHHGRPPSRRVIVHHKDFNKHLDLVLKAGRIGRNSAVFALLDQRNTECHWRTVERLAAYKGRNRIELLYFLGIGWLHRSLTQSRRPERLEEIDAWWGGPGWKDLAGLTRDEISIRVSRRFQEELGYRYANFWPVFLREGSEKRAFVLIHASDHQEAPKLMRRAYEAIYGQRPGTLTDPQLSLLDPDPLAAQLPDRER